MSFKISEVCDINSLNLSKNDNLKTINYLDTANLNVGTVDELQYMEVGKDKIPSRAKRIVRKNDILISTVRPNQKHYGIIKNVAKNMVASTGFAVLTPKKDKVDPGYIYNYLIQDHITTYLHSIAESSTSAYPSIKPSVIGELEVDLPPLEEQKAIAHILSTLDDKIEVNNQINKTLENMAQAIFKQWFVDFEFPNEDGEPYRSSGGEMVESELGMIPKGWEVKKVEQVTKIIRGASPRPIQDFIRDEGIPWVKISDASSSNTRFISSTKEFIKEEGRKKSREVKVGTLILSNSATPGIPMIMKIDACVHDGWLIFDEFREVTKEYMFHFLTENRIGILSLSNGSVFRNLKTDILKNYKIIIPSRDVVVRVDNIFKSINNSIDNIENQITTLTKIRDGLLTKLMSGEIRVPLDEEGDVS
ncbi:TPA: restriction endonuclease subunit S [Streptococcus suis]|nr:restriction endonuclease subunit S [Streptococcus suis]